MIGSQLAEDGFNEQKNDTSPYQNRRSSLETMFASLRKSELLSTKHDYKDIAQVNEARGQGHHLKHSDFSPPFHEMPEVLKSVQSFQQKPAFFTCKADDWGAQFADQELGKMLRRTHQEHKLQNVWLAKAFDFRNNLAVRMVHSDGRPMSGWYLALGDFTRSCAVAWPMTECNVTSPDGVVRRYLRFNQIKR